MTAFPDARPAGADPGADAGADAGARPAPAPVIAFVVACNDDAILEANLLRSPAIASGACALRVETGAPSASIAYNRGLDAPETASADLVVFVHQDVYLPEGWDALLRARVAEVEALDPDWAMLGSFGVGLDNLGLGPVWSTSLGAVVGRVPSVPAPVQSYDELLMVMRRSSGLRFDEGLPGFHLYGTDIVQEALSRGLGCYVAALPAVHNDRYHGQLGDDFAAGFHYVRRKWRARLPLYSPILRIARHGLDLRRVRRSNASSVAVRHALAQPTDTDPRVYAGLCGWNDLAPREDR